MKKDNQSPQDSQLSKRIREVSPKREFDDRTHTPETEQINSRVDTQRGEKIMGQCINCGAEALETHNFCFNCEEKYTEELKKEEKK